MIDTDQEIRRRVLARLRSIAGGELPDWLASEAAAESYADHVLATVRATPPLTDDQRQRVAARLRPFATSGDGDDATG